MFDNLNKISKKEFSPELSAEFEREASSTQNGRLSAVDKIKLNTISNTGTVEVSKEVGVSDENISYAISPKEITIGTLTTTGMEIASGPTGKEPIIFRQYQGTEEDPYSSIKNYVIILDENGNTIFGGDVYCNQIVSKVADGETPLIIESKTLVENLNSDLLDGKHGSQYHRSSDKARVLEVIRFATISSPTTEYLYSCALAIDDILITSNTVVEVHFDKSSIFEAGSCNVCADSGTGIITFYTTRKPTKNLGIQYIKAYDL